MNINIPGFRDNHSFYMCVYACSISNMEPDDLLTQNLFRTLWHRRTCKSHTL